MSAANRMRKIADRVTAPADAAWLRSYADLLDRGTSELAAIQERLEKYDAEYGTTLRRRPGRPRMAYGKLG